MSGRLDIAYATVRTRSDGNFDLTLTGKHGTPLSELLRDGGFKIGDGIVIVLRSEFERITSPMNATSPLAENDE